MTNTKKYNFSFTGFSLRINEMFKVAEAINSGRSIGMEEVGEGNRNTGQRRLVEIKKRLSQLTNKELELFLKGDFITQKQIAFLSVCKSHDFIRDFMVEVLREKYLLFDYEITEGNYISFYRRKVDLHPEMDEITEITQNKIRQVTFKILEQAGLIDSTKSKIIQPQILGNDVIQVIVEDNPEWLKVFLLSDLDINSLIK